MALSLHTEMSNRNRGVVMGAVAFLSCFVLAFASSSVTMSPGESDAVEEDGEPMLSVVVDSGVVMSGGAEYNLSVREDAGRMVLTVTADY